MAQSFQASQRWLATLNRTCRYFRSRPTLLSNYFRNQSGIAFAGPPTTGFSITFADGPLENIIAKPSDPCTEPSEAPKRQKPKALTPRQAKVTARTKQHGAVEGASLEEVPSSKNNPMRKSKLKKRTTKKEKTGENQKKFASLVTQATSRSGDSAWHETDELEMEEVTESSNEEQLSQRDYPDTRTIQEAGRFVHTLQDDTATKPETKDSGGSPRPLSTYKQNWQVQKAVLKNKFAEGWNPRKKLSPDTMEGIRALHAQYPDRYTTPVLAEQFAVSPEAIRRILKSKWTNNLEPEKAAEMRERWARRHDRIWDIKSEIGLRPKRKGAKEMEDPDQFEEELRGRQLLEAYRNA